MGSALLQFEGQPVHRQSGAALSHCEITLSTITPGSDDRLYLKLALERSLLNEPHPSTSLLREVQDSRSPVVARFEHGDESLEQRLFALERQPAPLPLPFLWSVRVVAEAAAALGYHHELGISSAAELSPRGIITVHGETRLNAAILEPRAKLASVSEPHRLSLATTLAACLGGGHSRRRLGLTRPLLPACLIRFIDDASSRAAQDSNWQSECELLKQQQRRLLGAHFARSTPARYSQQELCAHQLSLLPALLRIEGAAAVSAFFEQRAQGAANGVEQFRAACAAWRREQHLAASAPLASSTTLERARLDQEIASRARVAQARFEFERRDPRAGLLFAIDATQATPESPEAWLLLAEIRAKTCAGSQALCLSEAICAARGEPQVIERVLQLLDLRDPRKLAAYFRVHGDYVLGNWLDPSPSFRSQSRLEH